MKKIASFLIALVTSSAFLYAGGSLLYKSIQSVKNWHTTMGRIVDISSHVNNSRKSRGKTTYSPILEFQTPDKQTHRFISPISSSLRPTIGEVREILYNPKQPSQGRIKSILELYLFPSIFLFFGILGLCIFVIFPPAHEAYKRRKMERLRSTGRPIQAQLTGSGPTGTRVNNVPYFAITAQWVDPSTNTVHLFKSFSMPFDPSPVLEGRKTIAVYINPANIKDYWMDTTFLPQTES